MEQFRELARAVALGDLTGANIILDLMARDGFDRDDFADEVEAGRALREQVELGRSDAAAIRRRNCAPPPLLAAA